MASVIADISQLIVQPRYNPTIIRWTDVTLFAAIKKALPSPAPVWVRAELDIQEAWNA